MHDANQPRGDWSDQPTYTAGKEGHEVRDQRERADVDLKPLENKASPPEWCPQGCGASASHGRAGTGTQNHNVPSTTG